MKNFLISIFLFSIVQGASAQGSFCDVNGNLMIFTNYDGGPLNIDVDVDIPNLKIGIVSYEATQITLSGTYVNNVTGVTYAGYSGTNNHCFSGTTTTITGAPATAPLNILFAPPVTLANSNGYTSIICGTKCDISTPTGGCNTIDQIEAFMTSHFPSSVVMAHRVQYGCWSGTQSLSAGGDCCAFITNLTLTTRAIDESCASACDGEVIAGAAGGQPPYNISINGTTNFTNLCTGSYNIMVVDGASSTANATQNVASTGALPPVGSNTQTFCGEATVADLVATGSNLQWYDVPTGGSPLAASTILADNQTYYGTQTVSGCESGNRLDVLVNIDVADVSVTQHNNVLTANAAGLSYQWVDCSNGFTPISGATSQQFTPAANGIYAVIIIENSCFDTSMCLAVETIGIESAVDAGWQVFPNPAHTTLYLRSAMPVQQAVLRMYDVQGQLALDQEQVSGNLITLDVSELPDGIYFLNVITTTGVVQQKILIQ